MNHVSNVPDHDRDEQQASPPSTAGASSPEQDASSNLQWDFDVHEPADKPPDGAGRRSPDPDRGLDEADDDSDDTSGKQSV